MSRQRELTLRGDDDLDDEGDVDDVLAKMDRIRDRHRRAHARAERLLLDHKLIAIGEDDYADYFLLHPATRPGAEWQVSYFDRRGPFGHAEGATAEEAVSRALDMRRVSPVREVPEEEFLELTQTESFVEGSKATEATQIENEIRAVYGHEALGPYRAAMREAESIDDLVSVLRGALRELRGELRENPAEEAGEDGPLYHVTWYSNLESIAEEGLSPEYGGAIGVGGYLAHSGGRLFLTEPEGVRFWVNRSEAFAQHNSDDMYEDELLPVVLRIVPPDDDELEPDPIGSRDALAEAYMTKAAIDPDDIEVWTGSEWVPVEDWDEVDFEGSFRDPDYDDEPRLLRNDAEVMKPDFDAE